MNGLLLKVFFFFIRWQFLTDHHNVGFSVERKLLPPSELAGGKHNSEIIVPLQKVNSHIVPEDGCITCDKAGTCKSAS